MSMASLIIPRNSDLDSRVRDYLDDKLQAPADFEGLEALLEQARSQQELLKKQLDEATVDLERATQKIHGKKTSIREKVEIFQEQQSDIDQRLIDFTKAKTSDDAVQIFESSMAKLRRLDLASGYLHLLQEIDALVKQARDDCQTSTRSALPAYTRLRSLVRALQDAQPAAEGAAPHLVDHAEQQTSKVYAQLKDAASADLNKTLERMGWPRKDLTIDSQTGTMWAEQVITLLELQEPDLMSQSSKLQDEPSVAQFILLPLEVMVHPLQLRFRYHFYGNRATNRLDKPEYFLSHILDLLEDHHGFLLEYLQPILDERSGSAPELDDLLYPDATSAFISALLPMVRAKVLALLPQISSQPQLLSHFMHELMSFDTTLRDSWAYTPNPQSLSDWKGLTWSVLVTHHYFDIWLKVEKDFALARYESIISAPDSRDIDYESTDAGSTKPTKSAIRVNDLLETITDRYRTLSSFSHKLRFLIDIQLEIFDQYHLRLHGSLERYIMDTSTLGKVIQGSTGTTSETNAKNDIHGMFGLESLCKVFGSAEYLERKMSDWGDDVFFLEIWDELQDRARRNASTNASVGRDLTVSEVASRTSATINQANDMDGTEADGGALFDETASAYRRLRLKAEEQINELLINAITASLRPYSKVTVWSSLASTYGTSNTPDMSSTSFSPSPALEATLRLLSDFLSFLSKVLSRAPLRRISRQLCLAIQNYIWDNVLMRHTFSAGGAEQFRGDVEDVQKVVDVSIHIPGEASRGMGRLNDGIRLLGLRIKPSSATPTTSRAAAGMGWDDDVETEEGWGFDVDDDGGGAAEGVAGGEGDGSDLDEDHGGGVWSLWEVERRLFKSNESARDVLAQMGIETLNESDARAVLARRVEIGS